MKHWMTAGLLTLLLVLAGCTPTIYGIPQERWDTMGEQERIAAMDAYQARQQVLRLQREERARQQAIEEARQRAIEEEENRQRQLRVEAIYRGEGVYGDLLRVTIQDGRMKLHGSHRAYQPVAFRIAAGEVREVQVVDRKGRTAPLTIGYDGSTLRLDDRPGARRSPALQLVYDETWERGAAIPHLTSKGPLALDGVTVAIQVLGEPPRDRRSWRRPQVGVVHQPGPVPAPPVNLPVRGIDQRAPDPGVAAGKPPRHDRQDPDVQGKLKGPHPADVPPARLKVAFRKGQIQIKGKIHPIAPQSVELREGESRIVILRNGFDQVKIQVSYQKGEFIIDDHPGKGRPTTRLGFSREWREGAAYLIKATEHRLVEDLDLFVVAL